MIHLMKLKISYQELEKIIGGKIFPNKVKGILTALSYDTRTLQKGQAYIALKGTSLDGHIFISQAIKKGANLIILEKRELKKYTAILKNTPYLIVKNTLLALQEIGKAHRLSKKIKIAAITGSNGKSTTKQMLTALLKEKGKTCSTQGNLNNQIGVPRSLMELAGTDKFGVFELGASHIGDIAEIARLALPDVAILTNVAPSHLGLFGSIENIYKTKTEILNYLNKDASVVFNGDDKFLKKLKNTYKGKKISFGFNDGNDIKIKDCSAFSFTYKGTVFNTGVILERHNKLNAAAACGAALAFGLSKNEIQKGLKKYKPMPMRLERHKIGKGEIILDCYNANPLSMENALQILSSYKSPRIAVLGDMRELGKFSTKYHKELAKQIIKAKIDKVFLAGKEIKTTYKELSNLGHKEVKYSVDKLDFVKDLKAILKQKATVLLKASHSLNFEELFLKLKENK